MKLREFVTALGYKWEETELFQIIQSICKLKIWVGIEHCVKQDVWIAGGALRRTILGQSIQKADVDFFFADKQAYNKFHDILTKECDGVKVEERETNTTYLGSPIHPVVQAIKHKWYDSPLSIMDSFDFTNCQLVSDGMHLWTGDLTMFDLGRKRLRPHKITMPVASTRRMIKYVKQGFYACNGCIAELLRSATEHGINEEYEYID